jgi:XTP/dITP diphosphohydrolase
VSIPLRAPRRLVVASNNPGKLREFETLLRPLGIEVSAQAELGVGEAAEPYGTFIENALTKARHACRETGLAALADDSGLCVDALDGAPGVLSARYAGDAKSDLQNNQKLVTALRDVADRRAHYYCVLVLLRAADDPVPLIAEGRWDGEVILEPRGGGGFGYDPHFFLPDAGCTAAELGALQKNQLSHRARALRALLARLSAS